MSTTQTTPDGLWIVTTTITAAPPKPPVIPDTATCVLIDNAPNWKGDYDTETPKIATGVSKYVDVNNGRNYNVAYTNKAGFRFHVSFATVKAPVFNFCTDLYVKCDDWKEVQNLEIDMNQVMPDGRTVIMGIQAATGSKSWEYTTTPNNKSHWNKSNIAVDPSTWQAGVWKHLRLFYSCTLDGTVTYIGIEVDGIYTPFQNATGVSILALGWKPIGLLLCNFQQEGNTAKGTINIYAKQYQQFCW